MKSKERVSKFGEVFTPERQVDAMLDLVMDETIRIDSRFLEPACGNGNFLIKILKRKINEVKKLYAKNQYDFQKYIIISVSSIYGIEILPDNVEECRENLYNIVLEIYSSLFSNPNKKFLKVVKFIISKNIIHGDALTLKVQNGDNPIVFSEWCFVKGDKIKRTEYQLSNIIAYQPFNSDSLFSDVGDNVFLSKPLKKFPLVNYMDLINE